MCGLVPSIQVALPASSGFPALSSPPALRYLQSKERERERRIIYFLMPLKPHVLTLYWGERPVWNVKAVLTPAAPEGSGFRSGTCRLLVVGFFTSWLINAKGKAVFTELGPSWELVPPS